ncbi:MAG: hypothetical protein PSV16_11045 [Flavobacterium sp.]|nr:hypothetical protein [Flavobacterium sp.]
MNEFHGIILYEIERNGNLNGVYTNNHPFTNSRIFTETATLRGEVSFEGEIETRIYDCFYFDAVDGATNCTLIFRIINGIYQGQWIFDNGDVIFIGEGFQMNDRQIAISYWLP